MTSGMMADVGQVYALLDTGMRVEVYNASGTLRWLLPIIDPTTLTMKVAAPEKTGET